MLVLFGLRWMSWWIEIGYKLFVFVLSELMNVFVCDSGDDCYYYCYLKFFLIFRVFIIEICSKLFDWFEIGD